MKLLAHITTDATGRRVEQSLCEHCRHTAEYAAKSMENSGFGQLAYLSGLLHDMGKAKEEYQDYLEKAYNGENVKRGSVNHTFAGVIYILEKFHENSHIPVQKLTAEIVSYAIGSHHGLFDCLEQIPRNGFDYRLKKERGLIGYEEARKNFLVQVADEAEIKDLFEKAEEEVQTFISRAILDWPKQPNQQFFLVGLLTRMVLSSVIYGDRKDTAEFMDGRYSASPQAVNWEKEKNNLEKILHNFNCDTELNKVRTLISDQCLNAADLPAGIYKLNVPTGGGKTLSTLRFSLAHAARYNKKRIFFIIPLLSVLEQNAQVIRNSVTDKGMVAEHHSNVIQDAKKDGAESADYEILAENWEAPIMITTLVQLLNSLFTAQTSAVSRMRALCDSIIVIDEVQSLPRKITAMFNMALNFLSHYCNTTIILASATQPCFDRTDPPVKFVKEPNLVTLTARQRKVFARCQVVNQSMYCSEFPDFCLKLGKEHSSLLVICNTKKEARKLYRYISESAEADNWLVRHLSTAMCKNHRLEVLDELQEKLKEQQQVLKNGGIPKKVICIATQMVEAGIDISFACVVRLKAGIDNLAQSAGRCNRSNEYGDGCLVYFVTLIDERKEAALPKEIEDAQSSTDDVLYKIQKSETELSLIGEEAAQIYYQSLYRENMELYQYPTDPFLGKKGSCLYKLFGNNVEYYDQSICGDYIMKQPYHWIGEKFQVFDENTTDIIVPYKDGEQLITELMNTDYMSFSKKKALLEKAKSYSISIFDHQKAKLIDKGLLSGISQFDDRILVLAKNAYDDNYGLNDEAELFI